MAVIAHEPTNGGVEKLSERRVDVEEVRSLQIVRSELSSNIIKSVYIISTVIFGKLPCSVMLVIVANLSKMHFIEDNFLRIANLVEACGEC